MSINGYGYDRGGDVTPLFGGQPGAPVPRSRRDERRADEAMRAEQRRADQTQRDQQRLDAELARREADRLDERARREERRADADAELERKRARRTDAQREKARAKKEKAARSAARRAAFVAAVTEHMPLIGIPVVAVSLVVGWTGQAQAAAHLGMGAMALGIPVLTEGMVLTLAGLTAHAIGAKPQLPYRGLYRATWTAGLFAAASNAGGHLIEDASPQGVYRAAAYALASLAGLVLWAIVMRAKRAAADGASAAEVARWRRIRRSHPVVARRAQRIADLSGREFPEAFALAWERRTAAGTDEPTIREIRRQRGATWSRAQAGRGTGTPRRARSRTRSRRFPPTPPRPFRRTRTRVPAPSSPRRFRCWLRVPGCGFPRVRTDGSSGPLRRFPEPTPRGPEACSRLGSGRLRRSSTRRPTRRPNRFRRCSRTGY